MASSRGLDVSNYFVNRHISSKILWSHSVALMQELWILLVVIITFTVVNYNKEAFSPWTFKIVSLSRFQLSQMQLKVGAKSREFKIGNWIKNCFKIQNWKFRNNKSSNNNKFCFPTNTWVFFQKIFVSLNKFKFFILDNLKIVCCCSLCNPSPGSPLAPPLDKVWMGFQVNVFVHSI